MTYVEYTGSANDPGIQSSRFQTIRIYAPDIVSLPPPGEEWEFAEEDIDKSAFKRLQAKDLVSKTRHYRDDKPSRWTICKRVYDLAQDIVSRPGRLSCCGSSGITNDGGDIQCSRCGTAVPEEELDRVFA